MSRYGHSQSPHQVLYTLIDHRRAAYHELFQELLTHLPQPLTLKRAKDETDPNAPTWNNGFLPELDLVGLYEMPAPLR